VDAPGDELHRLRKVLEGGNIKASDVTVMNVEIRPALPEDHDSGSVWLTLPSSIPHRSIVKITRQPDGERIYCEGLAIGFYFVERYNQRIKDKYPELELTPRFNESDRLLLDDQDEGLIFINAYYREKLGRPEQFRFVQLQVSRADGFWNHMRASFEHPQLGIRLSIKLGLWGLLLGSLLGALSVVLGVISLRK